MSKAMHFFGYFRAAASILLFAALVMLSQQPSLDTNNVLKLSISPRVNGGEVAHVISHKGYEARLHKPVFDGILKDRRSGFVQIEWKPVSEALPDKIIEDIDYDNNGKTDFTIHFDTSSNTVNIDKHCPEVIGISKEWIFSYDDVKGVRVNLHKQ